jgi:hypothetical protein
MKLPFFLKFVNKNHQVQVPYNGLIKSEFLLLFTDVILPI